MVSDRIVAASVLLLNVVTPLVLMAAFRQTAERAWPVSPPRKAGRGLNIVGYLIWYGAVLIAAPGATLVGTLLANQFGGGLIPLPSHGWSAVAGFLIYFAARDLAEYLFHRAEHLFPWLWSMHSLHHSDTDLDSTTSVLHYWPVPILQLLLTSVPMGLLFKVPPVYFFFATVLSYYAYLIHANVRLGFGRLSWMITSPSYHRLHHSAQPEHFNCNYSSILPIWDVLFGTYRRPQPGEWPVVGLDTGDRAKTVLDLVFWPVRTAMRASLGSLIGAKQG